MWYGSSSRLNIRIIPIFFLSLIPSRHNHHAKIIIIIVIFGLTPYHKNPKPHQTDIALGPKAQRFSTMFLRFVRCPRLVLVLYLLAKVGFVSSLGKTSHIESVLCHHMFTTKVAKYVWIVSAMPSLSAHFYYFLICSFIQDNVTKFSCK